MRTTHERGLAYLITGVSLGLLAGLLWAPRRGRETREELRRGATGELDRLREEAGKARAEAERWFGRMKEQFRKYRNPAGDDQQGAGANKP